MIFHHKRSRRRYRGNGHHFRIKEAHRGLPLSFYNHEPEKQQKLLVATHKHKVKLQSTKSSSEQKKVTM
jgi:hypothetical protein